MKFIKYIFLFLILAAITSFKSGRKWVLQKNENGIAIYTRVSVGSDIKEVKVVNKVKSTLAGMVALQLDTKNYTNWIRRCGEGKTLKVISDYEIMKYQLTVAPWPISNRDLVSDFKITQNSQTGVINIIDSVAPSFIPEREGTIRIKHFRAQYILTKLPNGELNSDYEMFVDPDGAIPDWLVNDNIVDAPYANALSMIQQLPKYQGAKYSFIKE